MSKSYDALQTLEKSDTLAGLVMTTIDKLPHVKPDLVRTDENWDKGELITNLKKWIKRNKPSETSGNVSDNSRFKKEKHWFTSGRETQPPYARKQGPHCLFCKGKHWGDTCETFDTMDKRKKFFVEGRLCFNCGRHRQRENKCKSRECIKCKAKNHTSLCDKTNATVTKEQDKENTPKVEKTYTGYTSKADSEALSPIVPVETQRETFWVHLDTGSGRDFISSDAVKKLCLQPIRYETRHIFDC